MISAVAPSSAITKCFANRPANAYTATILPQLTEPSSNMSSTTLRKVEATLSVVTSSSFTIPLNKYSCFANISSTLRLIVNEYRLLTGLFPVPHTYVAMSTASSAAILSTAILNSLYVDSAGLEFWIWTAQSETQAFICMTVSCPGNTSTYAISQLSWVHLFLLTGVPSMEYLYQWIFVVSVEGKNHF